MPNIKSAIKRVNVIETKTMQNNMVKSAYKTAVKSFKTAVEEKDLEKAKDLFAKAEKAVDKACSKGVIKKNTASRKKSSLSKLLNTINA